MQSVLIAALAVTTGSGSPTALFPVTKPLLRLHFRNHVVIHGFHDVGKGGLDEKLIRWPVGKYTGLGETWNQQQDKDDDHGNDNQSFIRDKPTLDRMYFVTVCNL